MRWTASINRALNTVARVAGEEVMYRRGENSVTLKATRGDKASLQEQTGSESAVQSVRLDWIITRDTLTIVSGPIDPIEGDEITDSAGVRYRVTKSPADGKCARWLRHSGAMRIHTIVIEGLK